MSPGVGLTTDCIGAHWSPFATKHIAEPLAAHFGVNSRLDGNSWYEVFSEKTSVIVPFEERQPSLVQATHICILHEERSLLEWSHFSPSEE
jgi:hypothetical protein